MITIDDYSYVVGIVNVGHFKSDVTEIENNNGSLYWPGSKYLPSWKLKHEGIVYEIDADFIDDSNCYKMSARIIDQLKQTSDTKVIKAIKIQHVQWAKFIANELSKYESDDIMKQCTELEDEGHFLVNWY